MNKILAYIFVFALVLQVRAQDDDYDSIISGLDKGKDKGTSSSSSSFVSKKGIPILPEAGEWALGISANPFLQFVGNAANGDTFNPNPTFQEYFNSIYWKLMLDANTAVRVRFGYTHQTTLDKRVTRMDELSPDDDYPSFVEDWQKFSNINLNLAAGLEKRRGKGRVQGVYGGELVITLRNQKNSYQYGNPYSIDFAEPQTAQFFGNQILVPDNIIAGSAAATEERVIEEKSGTNFNVGARGFIGAEFFVGPKISLGGELGYIIRAELESRGSYTTEKWSPVTQGTLETTYDGYDDGFNIIGGSLDNLNGQIYVLFYF